mmetsp:Transcript_85066/g.259867  ORF Transcript_85066/g.259867 Transcript_85066/m.259867 type:complete len:650 (+) Transcript_85066:880-2829(+)
MDQKDITKHDLVLDCLVVRVGRRVGQKVPKQRPNHRLAQPVVFVEHGVPQGEQPVPQLQGRLDVEHRGLVESVGLAARRLQVRVVAEEGVREHPELVPPHGHLGVGVLEEAPDIGADQRLAPERERADHGNGGAQVLPLRVIVARPDGRVLVGADEERAGQDEGAVPRHALREALESGAVHVVAVHVVHIAMLHVAIRVDGVPGHGDLRPVENRWLVHVVPNVRVRVRACVFVQRELRTPVLAHLRVGKVGVPRSPGPTPTFVIGLGRLRICDLPRLPLPLVGRVVNLRVLPRPILLLVPLFGLGGRGVQDLVRLVPVGRLGVRGVVHHRPIDLLHEVPLVADLLEHVELIVLLDVWVHHVDELPALRGDRIDHLARRGEVGRVPREVRLPVGVLDVQPHDVVGDVVLVEALVHGVHIPLAHVVPPALVLAQGPERWHGRGTCERVKLGGHLRRRRPNEDDSVQHAAFACPPRVRRAGVRGPVALQLDESLRRIDPQERRRHVVILACWSALDGPQKWHRAVQRHGLIVFVLENIEVEETVGLLVKRKTCLRHVLRQAEQAWHVALECHVHAQRSRPTRFFVRVAAEVFLPEAVHVEVVRMGRRVEDDGVGRRRGVARGVGRESRLGLPVALEVEEIAAVQPLDQLAID